MNKVILMGRVVRDPEEVPQVAFIDAVYIDEDGSIKVIHDEARHFQFVRRKTEVQ